MNERKKSKEELFLKKLHDLASALGDPEAEIDRYRVGSELGEHKKRTDNIVQLLAKNGFLKKNGTSLVYLTPAGIQFLKDNV